MKYFQNLLIGAFVFSAVSCGTGYHVTGIEGKSVAINAEYSDLDSELIGYISDKKEDIVEEMAPVVCVASAPLVSESRSFNPLANVISDVIRDGAAEIEGKEIDFAIINVGGLRRDIPKGNVTVGTVFELLPFMNTLCVMNMDGEAMNELFEQIALVGGEGVSGGTVLTISKDGKLLDAKINGKSVEPERVYRVATIDYIAEGNDGLEAFKKATGKVYPEDALLRDMFMRYLKKLNEEGKMLDPKNDIRIIVK